MDITPKELCDLGICASQAEARRVIAHMEAYPGHGKNLLMGNLIAARRRIAELEQALLEAADDVADWGAYASEFTQYKHDLAGNVERIRQAVKSEVKP